jgi:hypothetical protein
LFAFAGDLTNKNTFLFQTKFFHAKNNLPSPTVSPPPQMFIPLPARGLGKQILKTFFDGVYLCVGRNRFSTIEFLD